MVLRHFRPACLSILLLGAAFPCRLEAAVANLAPFADTTLSENYPSNNLGGLDFFIAGTTQNFTRNRGLIRFDLSVLPPRSVIRSASLILEVTGQPNEPFAFADFALFRLLRRWNEGTKVSPTNCASCRGQGSAATIGEATWFYREMGTTNEWSAGGGTAGLDYANVPSSSTTIYGVGDSPYTFPSSANMITDVQSWVDAPEVNFGWVLLCLSEEINFTARRFGSKEDPPNAPRLSVDYLAPPAFSAFGVTPEGFAISFVALPGQAYEVQHSENLQSAIWRVLQSVDPPASPTNVTVHDSPLSINRFYRLVTR